MEKELKEKILFFSNGDWRHKILLTIFLYEKPFLKTSCHMLNNSFYYKIKLIYTLKQE
jgi:hypothetical protein